MKRIEDLSEEVQHIFRQVWYTVEPLDSRFPDRITIVERFFVAGYEAAIAERAKFDEINELIVKDIGEL